MRIDTQNTQNTPNSARSHYDINSVIHIHLITINNVSFSHSSAHVRLLHECMLNDPDFLGHPTRPPPVKAAISHGDSRDSQSDTESLPTNCFVLNIESLPQPISDVYYPMCMITTLPPPPPPSTNVLPKQGAIGH